MPLFTWYTSYSINIEELDNHHKKLFNIFNRLYDNCMHVENVDCIGPIIEELISYSNYHFSAEEQYMTDKGYKDRDRHIQMHRGFSQRALHMRQIENKNDYELTKELIVYLGNWLLHHVLEEDKKMSA